MRMNPQQVRDMLGVSNHTLKYWRDTSRLPGGAENPLYLPAIPDDTNQNLVWYEVDAVMEFVARNERYRDHILAKFAPADVQQTIRPLTSLPLAGTLNQLRGTPTTVERDPAVPMGLLGGGFDYISEEVAPMEQPQ